MATRKATRRRISAHAHEGESWPYHMGPRGMVPCTNNPCRQHPADPDGTPNEFTATTLEAAERLYERAHADDPAPGMSGGRTAGPSVSPQVRFATLMRDPGLSMRERSPFDYSLDQSVNGRMDAQLAADQVGRIADDPEVPAGVAADYADWLAHAVARGDGAIDDSDLDPVPTAGHDPVLEAPAEYVLAPGSGADLTRGQREVTYIGTRDTSAVLRHFHKGEVASARALRALTSRQPSSGFAVGVNNLPFADDTERGHPADATVAGWPNRDTTLSWIDSSRNAERENLMEAARHPYGGMALENAHVHAQSRHAKDVDFSRRALADREAAAEVKRANVAARATDGMADMLTTADYAAFHKGAGDARATDVFASMAPVPADEAESFTSADFRRGVPSLFAEWRSGGHAPALHRGRATYVRTVAGANASGYPRSRVVRMLSASADSHDGAAARFMTAKPNELGPLLRSMSESERRHRPWTERAFARELALAGAEG